MKLSVTQIGNYVTILVTIFTLFGINVAPADLEATFRILGECGALIGAVISFYGRYRHGDVTLSGMKTPTE